MDLKLCAHRALTGNVNLLCGRGRDHNGLCMFTRPDAVPEGPWKWREAVNGGWFAYTTTPGPQGWDERSVGPLTSEKEAIAVRDALNRLKGDEK